MSTRQRLRSALIRVAGLAGWFVPVRLGEQPGNAASGVTAVLVDARLRTWPRQFSRKDTTYGFATSGSTGDLIQRRLFLFGVWEPELSHWMRGHLREGDYAVDVGANIGYFSLLASSAVSGAGKVYAYEPVPKIVGQLQSNKEDNAASNLVIRPFVVGEPGRNSVEMFEASRGNLGGSSSRRAESSVSVGMIPSVSLSEDIPEDEWDRIRLVKIDAEGDEISVLRGASRLLRRLPVGAAVVCEVSPERWSSDEVGTDPVAYMSGLGFSAKMIPNDYSVLAYAFPRKPRGPRNLSLPLTGQSDVIFTKMSE